MAAKTFRDLRAWQAARAFKLSVYGLIREELDAEAQEALIEIGGLLDYLQSPEAKLNAERIKQKRFERRDSRSNTEPRTQNKNLHPGTRNPEPDS